MGQSIGSLEHVGTETLEDPGSIYPIGSMVLVYVLTFGVIILMVNVTIYSSTMDPMGY